MGLIVDYGSLQSAIADWIWRVGDSNVAANITTFIDNFEREFKAENRFLDMHVGPTTAAVPSPPQIALPSDYLEMVRLQLVGLPEGTPNQPLKYVTADRAAWLDATTAPSGTPQWYTILGGKIVICPQPWVPAGADYELIYYGFTPLSSASGGVNWLLTKWPNLYLYGSLMQAAAYIDDKETVAEWAAAADKMTAKLQAADRKARAGGPLQMLPAMQFRTMRRRYPAPGA